MNKTVFITATDTDAGKTYVAQALTRALVKQNFKVAVFKPISAGCTQINGQLINEDAALLMAQANCSQTIEQVNPIAFEEAIAPHIAAQLHNKEISLLAIEQDYRQTQRLGADVVLCEGAGGWRLPLGNGTFLSEFVQRTQQQVILIVKLKLGCLNHAVLTYESIIADGLTCLGWVANCPNTMDYLEENISELTKLLPVPMLARFAYQPDLEKAATTLSFSMLPLLMS